MNVLRLKNSNSANRKFNQRALVLIPLVLACFALTLTARAVSPAPDGGYPNNNTAEGTSALLSLTTGINNSAVGFEALKADQSGNYNTATGTRALVSNVSGLYNTADGAFALAFNTGSYNTATGYQALYSNQGGNYNTANGVEALYLNTSGVNNTANGYLALFNNTTGNDNTATGVVALDRNTSGNYNTANGYQTLYHNTTGSNNTAMGMNALVSNTTGVSNTAIGHQALLSNTSGNFNLAIGESALSGDTIGYENTAIGFQALSTNTTGHQNTAVGEFALSKATGTGNIALGNSAGVFITTGNYCIDIGSLGAANDSNSIRIGDNQGATFIAGIWGPNVGANGLPVYVNSAGQLGTNANSSRRFKMDVADMNSASDVLLSMRPVTFHYKPEVDAKGSPQWGLIAEEVAKLNPDLVVRDGKGEIFGVRYDAVNAMLLNEFLKEHRKVEEQQETIAQLRKEMETVLARLKEHDSEIQKVSDQIDLSKAAPRVAVSNP